MTREISEAHTAENLAEVLKQAIAVVEHLEVFHLPCAGYTLQLAVEKVCSGKSAQVSWTLQEIIMYM